MKTNRVVRSLGGPENLRFLQLALLPPRSALAMATSAVGAVGAGTSTCTPSLEMLAMANEDSWANNQGSGSAINVVAALNPVLVSTAFKKNRIYLFTNREPHDIKAEYVLNRCP